MKEMVAGVSFIDMNTLTQEMSAGGGNGRKSIIVTIIDSTEEGSRERDAIMMLLTEASQYTAPEAARILTACTPYRVTRDQVSGWRSRNNIRAGER